MAHTLWIDLPALTFIIERERERWGGREKGKEGRSEGGVGQRQTERPKKAFCILLILR